jgi:amino acid transporter
MEYAIGNITVAISWSDYLTTMLEQIHIEAIGLKGIYLPAWMQMDYLSASRGFQEAQLIVAKGADLSTLTPQLLDAQQAWMSAPRIGSFHLVLDIPALFIIVLITWLVYRGIKESRNASNAMVVIKLAVILVVIAVGVFYIDMNNWTPFAPEGMSGVLKGVSAVFFAYIGFDAISTTAEECENPQRDLPRGMMWAIIICTVLYIVIALILTGIVPYDQLAVGEPLAFVFEQINQPKMTFIISISAVVAMASVLLVFQMGQPRIWLSMSRDGLLPKRFSKIHPKYKTPSFATIVVGFVVAIPALFMNLTMVTDLCSIGTLFAFVLVCGGVLVLQNKPDVERGSFRTPYMNAGFVLPFVFLGALVYFYSSNDLINYFQFENWAAFGQKIPSLIFWSFALFLTIVSVPKKLSLIPCLGLLSCLYMMSEIPLQNWIYFGIWLLIGLVIYFTYSRKHSKLNPSNT